MFDEMGGANAIRAPYADVARWVEDTGVELLARRSLSSCYIAEIKSERRSQKCGCVRSRGSK